MKQQIRPSEKIFGSHAPLWCLTEPPDDMLHYPRNFTAQDVRNEA